MTGWRNAVHGANRQSGAEMLSANRSSQLDSFRRGDWGWSRSSSICSAPTFRRSSRSSRRENASIRLHPMGRRRAAKMRRSSVPIIF